MKAAAILALLVAISVGLWGSIDLVVTMNDRADAVRFRTGDLQLIAYDAQEREDGFLILFGMAVLAGSIALFAQARHNAAVNPPHVKAVVPSDSERYAAMR
jgi:hypothetical protein